jgi:hypothetical protein
LVNTLLQHLTNGKTVDSVILYLAKLDFHDGVVDFILHICMMCGDLITLYAWTVDVAEPIVKKFTNTEPFVLIFFFKIGEEMLLIILARECMLFADKSGPTYLSSGRETLFLLILI